MIQEREYAKRRGKIAKKLEKNSLALFYSAEQKSRSNDTEYPYRQDSNFYYLSGFKESSAALLFIKSNRSCKIYLFVQKREPTLELWSGKRLGVERAKEIFDVDAIFESEQLLERITQYSLESRVLYYDFSLNQSRVQELHRACKNITTYRDIAPAVEMLRLYKSKSEIALIKKALAITKIAHHQAMRRARELEYEYELQAEIEYIFKKNGAYSDAYTSIVASGNGANTLHYIENNKPLKRGDLILIDAGCEYDYYASDITRTIPVSGKFTRAQEELYKMVLEVEKEVISMIKPNVMRSDLQKKSQELLCRGMVRLGILKGSVKKLLAKEAYKKYYPHGIGHWMGIDVHDQAPYRYEDAREIPLAAGMVLTIEPGIYIDKDDKRAPRSYRGIGIRIEDDILVTKSGYEILSSDIAKEIEEIENI